MARLSTLGVTVGYGIEASAGVKPSTFTQIEECSNIAGVALSTESIDASALEDYITQYVEGRADTGGTWDLEFRLDPDKSMSQIEAMYTASNTAKASGLRTWWEVIVPGLTKAFFVVAACGSSEIPMPEMGQNDALTITLSLVINEYKGLDTKVAFSGGGGSTN